jgi:hypothetical protein
MSEVDSEVVVYEALTVPEGQLLHEDSWWWQSSQSSQPAMNAMPPIRAMAEKDAVRRVNQDFVIVDLLLNMRRNSSARFEHTRRGGSKGQTIEGKTGKQPSHWLIELSGSARHLSNAIPGGIGLRKYSCFAIFFRLSQLPACL